MNRSLRKLSASELQDAVYFDFEGHIDQPPFLLGMLWAHGRAPTFEQVVVSDTQVWKLPGRDKTPLPTEKLDRAIARLVAMARAEHRLLAAWSLYELDVIHKWCVLPPIETAYLNVAYRNCLPVARSWKARCYPNLTFDRDRRGGRNRLYRYLDLIGYRIPSYLGREQTGQRLSYVTSQLEKRGLRFGDLTPVAKSKWQKLLEHNKQDCYGLKALMERVEEGCTPQGDRSRRYGSNEC